MNIKTMLVSMLGLVGMGPLASLPDTQPKPERKITQADLERIEKAKQKRLRKMSRAEILDGMG